MDILITMKKFDFLSFLTQWKEQHEIEAITNDLYFIELYNLVKNEDCDTEFTINPYGFGVNVKSNNWELPYSLMKPAKQIKEGVWASELNHSLFGEYLFSIREELGKKLGYPYLTK